jgi:hypothetical protein
MSLGPNDGAVSYGQAVVAAARLADAGNQGRDARRRKWLD